MSEPKFVCNLMAPAEPLIHYWETCVGSGHATLALRADWQQQLARCRRELGFKRVRFHGLFDDDMGTLVDENDKLVYSFFNADQICDFLLSIDMKPFMELSFMPSTLASEDKIVFHYKGNITPPKDYAAWGTLIENITSHWVERYGINEVKQWFFEVWNEPNLDAFWTGTQADYFKLYQTTAQAIKKVNPALQVGGPATAKNEWIPEFLEFCEKNKVPADFVSTHHYPTDAFGKPGDDTLTQLAESKRSVLRDQVAEAQKQAKGKPLYYTEWCTSSNPFDELHDQAYAAAYVTKTIMEGRGFTQGYSYWTFSDIFEENYFSSEPFHGGFGLMNIYGVPKPAYRAFELLHKLGTEFLKVEGTHETVDAWVVRKEQQIQILITQSVLPRHEAKNEMVKIELNAVSAIRNAYVERIDDEHGNSRSVWEKMGKPATLSRATVSALEAMSKLIPEPMNIEVQDSRALIQIMIPPQGTALITLEMDA